MSGTDSSLSIISTYHKTRPLRFQQELYMLSLDGTCRPLQLRVDLLPSAVRGMKVMILVTMQPFKPASTMRGPIVANLQRCVTGTNQRQPK